MELATLEGPVRDVITLWPEERFGALLGRAPVMRALFARLAKVAAADSTVLLEGEAGSGKELAARAIHAASLRRDAPFVVLDCAARPLPLAQVMEEASAGTVFLDEV